MTLLPPPSDGEGRGKDMLEEMTRYRAAVPCTFSRPSLRPWRRPMSPSTSASRRPRSSCCPFPTATSRRWPPPGSRTPMSCRPCGWPASSGCGIRCRSTSMSKASWRGRASSSCAAWAASITGAMASSTSPTWRATTACCSPPCRATTAPIPGSPRRRPWPPSRWPGSTASSAKAAPRICGRRCATSRRCWAATSPGRRRCRSARSRFWARRRTGARSRWSSSIAPT